MEIESLDKVCEELRQEVAAELESRPGKRWRCPVPLRSRIVSYAKVCRERGEPLLAITDRLGLVESTLARWLRADRKALALAPGFRSVSVVEGEDRLVVARNRKRAKVLMWDGTGLCLYAKRLEKGRFAKLWAGEDITTIELTMSELQLFLNRCQEKLSQLCYPCQPLLSPVSQHNTRKFTKFLLALFLFSSQMRS